MIVMKFGGSSVADAAAIDRVAAIAASRVEEEPVIVVSAVGDTTDRLISVLDAVARGDVECARCVTRAIAADHGALIAQLVPAGPASAAAAALEREGAALARYVEGMAALGEVSARSRDAVLAFGETVAPALVADALSARGVPAIAVDPRGVVVTDSRHGAATPDERATAERARRLTAAILGTGRVPVIGGFVGADSEGVTTTLGRGGSDLTASLLAASLRASRLEFWKDVDGILTADPKVVPDARPVPHLTFREASELAFLGARVLHPASIKPAVDAGVPVRVLNSHRPAAPGTEIAARADDAPRTAAATSIAHKRDQVLVNVHSSRMLGATGFLRRVFEVFDRLGISVDHIATSEVNVTVTIGAHPGLERLASELSEIAAVTMRPAVGVVSAVGERLSAVPGAASEVLRALEGTDIRLLTFGGFGANISVVVDDDQVEPAVRRLHERLLSLAPRLQEVHRV